jgi:LuxR family maltose regulon positive regulatory protein
MDSRRRSVEPTLVATKLHIPSLRDGLVRRDRLVAQLLAGAERRLTLVCAPAGWGKTVLLAQWHASVGESRPFAWVQLDPNDDDPVRLWRHVIGALRTVEPAIGAQALGSLPVAGPALVDAVVGPLLNDLTTMPRAVVLVLDDYHLIHDPRNHAAVGYLLRHLPANVRVAIASRADPPLPLASLRAASELTEIRAAELRFARDEAGALLNHSLALGLAAADVETLRSRTEGWVAGLQLAALSARTAGDRHAFVAAFAGDDRQIGDYLHEVLAEQPAERRAFLLQTSVLERMTAPLCDAVTGRDDSRDQLEAIERANLFIEPLDTRREWYRYHQLFAELLRAELGHAAGATVAQLHRRASAWFREHGEIEDAIAHATAAHDVAEAADLIAMHWRPVWSQGQFETVARWIDALPAGAAESDARLCLARGWSALYLGDPAASDRWRRAAEVAPLPAALQDGTSSVAEATSILEAAHANLTGDAGGAVDAAQRALGQNRDPAAPSRVIANVHLGMAAYYAGDTDLAESACATALASPLADEWASVRVVALGNLAAIAVEGGDLDRAGQLLGATNEAIEEFGVQESGFAARSWMATGMVHEIHGDLAAAETALARAVELARRVGSRLVIAHGLLLLSAVTRRRGQHRDARTLAREARGMLDACPDPGVLAARLAAMERSLQLAPGGSRSAAGSDVRLSDRELAVLRLFAGERSQREIADQLFVSFDTVKSHARSIYRKLDVGSRAEAVARGRERGLL